MKYLLLFTSICGKILQPDEDGWYRIKKKIDSEKFNFFVLGDWGGWPAPLYQSIIQLNVATSMMRTAKSYKPEFVASLGDHFYFWGIQNTEDRMWQRTFEDVYVSDELHCPWYPVSGNHDWLPKRDGTGGNATAQLLYSAKSERWTYPDFFYTIEYETAGNTKMKMIMIDTPTLTGVYTGQVPDSPDGANPSDPVLAEKAWKWIEAELNNSATEDVDYLFVVGHYMIVEAQGLYDLPLHARLLPMMRKNKVSAYIQGHRHTLEHSQESGFTNMDDVHFFTIGAGAILDASAVLWTLNDHVPKQWTCDRDDRDNGESFCHYGWYTTDYDGGYGIVDIDNEFATVSIIKSDNDDVLYTTQISPRKLT